MKTVLIKFLLLMLVFGGFLFIPSLVIGETGVPWVKESQEGEKIILLHFFWSKDCPHCRKSKPFLEKLTQTHSWIDLKSYEVSESESNAQLFTVLSKRLGNERLGVPAFLFCEKILVGYLDDQTTGSFLHDQILECRKTILSEDPELKPTQSQEHESPIIIPFFGELDPGNLSLPVFTLVIAGLDAFNPCAFFVLLLLLSLLATAKSRKRMLLIGGIFVFFSGFIYFIFMSAWLNLFLYLGEIKVITSIAAVIAISVSLINIKDYFFFKKGISISIPEKAKPTLYKKIRELLNAASLPTMIFGVITLAVAANSYELLCTSGFPMVYTRILTMNELAPISYYLYLILYNIVYVIPLLVIVVIFVITLGSRKLTEKEGRVLKLTSGLMMLELGLLLLISPHLLSHLAVAFALMAGAVLLTILIVYCDKIFQVTNTS